MKRATLCVLLLLLSSVPFVRAKGGYSGGLSHARSAGPAKTPKTKCAACARDHHGRIKRSKTAVNEFKRSHPCPATGKSAGGCRGYVIDHVVPLKRGGADALGNMQWQTKAEAKAKDKVE